MDVEVMTTLVVEETSVIVALVDSAVDYNGFGNNGSNSGGSRTCNDNNQSSSLGFMEVEALASVVIVANTRKPRWLLWFQQCHSNGSCRKF
jgi:hypothetical protein